MGGSEPSKSSVQCRHKIEKLRKRYRQEKQIEEQRGPRSSSWPFFEHMDAMERGRSITKLSPSSLTLARATSNGNSVRSNRLRLRWHDSSDKDYEPPASASKEARDTSPSKPRILGSVRLTTKLRQNAERNYVESPRVTLRPKVRRNYAMDDDCVSMDDKESLPDSSKLDCLSKRMNSELISVIRSLGEGFLKIEQMKLEMQRDNERLRADLELKRVGMLLDSQKEIAEMFTRALTGKKGVKKRQLQEL
ncbi:hypothetical protein KP509_10G056800 [Ceratopteris richardii]|nr:hypothetical protein KP509_10G056800 [Ceratopteris richardii]